MALIGFINTITATLAPSLHCFEIRQWLVFFLYHLHILTKIYDPPAIIKSTNRSFQIRKWKEERSIFLNQKMYEALCFLSVAKPQ